MMNRSVRHTGKNIASRLLTVVACVVFTITLTGCIIDTTAMMENIAELGEYTTTSFDCSPSNYPDPVPPENSIVLNFLTIFDNR